MQHAGHAWVEDVLGSVFDAWATHADTPNGIFHPYLDRQWRHHTDGPRTLVSQCRLIYNFARAFERGGDRRYADLARRGLDALGRYFRHPDGEGWVWACDGDGRVRDDGYDAYGHAFVVLALATVADVFGEGRYRDEALATWRFMQRRFGDAHGGLIWHVARDGRTADEVRSQNPLMHTFEALLALAPLDESGTARADALALWRFVDGLQPAPGCLPEWYDPAWRPVPAGPRAIVEVGHAFEWAFLLSEAQPLFPGEDLLTPGGAFLAFGMRHGYDAGAGGIVSQVGYDGSPRGQRKGWWEQCEALRAIQRYVAYHGAVDLAGALGQTLTFVREHYVDETYGGWYECPPGMESTPSLAKGNAYKLDYHVVNLCRELLGT